MFHISGLRIHDLRDREARTLIILEAMVYLRKHKKSHAILHTFSSSATTYFLAMCSFPALHYKPPDVKVFEAHCLLSLVGAYPLITGTAEFFQCDVIAKIQFTTQFATRTVSSRCDC